MGDTKIEWAEKSWNPITGCTKISEGCLNCYAEKVATTRLKGRFGYPEDEPFRITFHRDKLNEFKKWKKPCRIFVCSMGDLFHEDVSTHAILNIYNTISYFNSQGLTSQHRFIFCTKRPERMIQFGGEENMWLLVSVENQHYAVQRIPILLKARQVYRYKVLGVSVEPMLGPVDLRPWLPLLDWVICGCESGQNRRPCKIEWIRDLRDQCVEAGVPFFLKQMEVSGKVVKMPELDGKVWDQYPKEKHND